MRLTRRNALIGLGTVAAGAGVIGGTGAFTSVQADRSVSVTTTGDSDAALQISPATDGATPSEGNLTVNADEYTNATGVNTLDGDTLSISLDSVNLDAETRIEDLFVVVNNGPQAVNLDFQIAGSSFSDLVGTDGSISLTVSGDSDYELATDSWVPGTAISLGQGGASPAFGLELDIPEATNQDTFGLELVIRAQA
jgi:hypothetical protein